MFVFYLAQISRCGDQLVTYSLKKLSFVGVDQRMTEQRHEVICHDYKVSACFRCPEVVSHKVVNGEVMLQFLDPVLRIRSSAVQVIYNPGRQAEIGDKTAVTVSAEIVLVPEQIQLPDLLAGGIRPFLYFLSDHYYSSGLAPAGRAVCRFGYFQTVRQLHPCVFMGEAVLDAVIEPAGYDIV